MLNCGFGDVTNRYIKLSTISKSSGILPAVYYKTLTRTTTIFRLHLFGTPKIFQNADNGSCQIQHPRLAVRYGSSSNRLLRNDAVL